MSSMTVDRYHALPEEHRAAAAAWIRRRGFALSDVWLVEVDGGQAVIHTYLRGGDGRIRLTEDRDAAATACTRVPTRGDPPPWLAAATE